MTFGRQFPQHIDATLCVEFLRCEHKALRKYMEGLHQVEKSTDLHAGGAFAMGLEAARMALMTGEGEKEALEIGKAVLAQAYGSHQPREGSGKSKGRMLDAFELYDSTWPLAQERLIPGGVEYAFKVELPRRHPVTGEALYYTGRMDRVEVEMPSLLAPDVQLLMPGDDKTTSSFGFGWVNSWDMSFQMLGYAWALQQQGYGVERVGVRGVAIPKTGALSAKEVFVQTPEWRTQQWYEDMMGTVERMLEAWKQDRWTRAWSNACNEYTGCEFKAACMAGPQSIADRLLAQTHAMRWWDPLKRGG